MPNKDRICECNTIVFEDIEPEKKEIQWLFLVPVQGGRWHIIPQLAVYTTYIPLIYCLLGGYMFYYHLLREPETTIEKCVDFRKSMGGRPSSLPEGRKS